MPKAAHPTPPQPLEITVIHGDTLRPEQVREFFEKKVVVIGTAGFGTNRADYPFTHVNQFDCMESLRRHGGAVIADYPGCHDENVRVIGWAVAADQFLEFPREIGERPLFGLRLDPWVMIDPKIISDESLHPPSRAISTCHPRAKGRLHEAVTLWREFARRVGPA